MEKMAAEQVASKKHNCTGTQFDDWALRDGQHKVSRLFLFGKRG